MPFDATTRTGWTDSDLLLQHRLLVEVVEVHRLPRWLFVIVTFAVLPLV